MLENIQKLKDLNLKSTSIADQLPTITYVGDPVLRQKADAVSFEQGMTTANELADILLAYRALVGSGRGLAAPQIGYAQAVFVTYVDDTIQIYLNPQLSITNTATNLYKECCISSNHLWCDVERPSEVTLTYTDRNNQLLTAKFDGFMARLIQHEYDHLQGLVNLDKAIPGTVGYCFGDPLQEKLRAPDNLATGLN